MPAASLEEAANTTYARVSLAWAAGTIRVKVQAFIVAAALVFDDNTPNDRPVGNWLIPLTSVSTQMNSTVGNPVAQSLFNITVDYIYRMCMAGFVAQAQSRISAPKAAALLAAWNANF